MQLHRIIVLMITLFVGDGIVCGKMMGAIHLSDETTRKIELHFQERTQLITDLMGVVSESVNTEKEILAKVEAINLLGRFRAEEAIDLLIAEIRFDNPYAPSEEFSWETAYPCVLALQEIGKPASHAALSAIGDLQINADSELKLRLLVLVIKGVEGKDVANFLIKSKTENEGQVRRANYEKALTYL